jgi:glycosidase
MPDLNQDNEFVANYLIQNSIWWVEYAGLDGIRMDTYPYSNQDFMQRWVKRMKLEYPDFTILGETWLQKEAITAYYAASENERFGYNSHLYCLTDFPLHYAIEKAFHEEEGWSEGLARLYYVLAQDFLYDDPYYNVIFADNHDLNRYFTSMQGDVKKYKMGLAYLLTTRGIPMVYYGTEILMEGYEHSGHGYIREDFPGGWKGDTINAFEGKGLNFEQAGAQAYLQHLLQWRKYSEAVIHGSIKHFIPEDGIYVYFRTYEDEKVMVVMNNNDEQKQMPSLDRFEECLQGSRSAADVINGSRIEDIQEQVIPSKTTMIFELVN